MQIPHYPQLNKSKILYFTLSFSILIFIFFIIDVPGVMAATSKDLLYSFKAELNRNMIFS